MSNEHTDFELCHFSGENLRNCFTAFLMSLGARGKPSTYVYRAKWLVEPFPCLVSLLLHDFIPVVTQPSLVSNNIGLCEESQKLDTFNWQNHAQFEKSEKLFEFSAFCWIFSAIQKSFLDTRKHSWKLPRHPRSFLHASQRLSRKVEISWNFLIFGVMPELILQERFFPNA